VSLQFQRRLNVLTIFNKGSTSESAFTSEHPVDARANFCVGDKLLLVELADAFFRAAVIFCRDVG